jgi:copper resistance protein D
VLMTVAPKIPQVTPAPFAEMHVGASSSLDPFGLPNDLQRVQSDFNHNISGVFVILAGLGALIFQTTGARWAKAWPLAFALLGVFLLIVGEPTGWPLGKEGLLATLASPEVLQHRLATLLVIVLGFVLWRGQSPRLAATNWRYMFPGLCAIGGALLLTHSHSVFALKWAYLIEITHNLIGILAVYIGAAGWIELRIPSGREHRIAGIIWPICLVLVGLVLMFYRETAP